ncbi:nitrilase-related carbon-nitrogen hydrolase [Carboxylicivirga sp. M1479]|uniref:nitrilase-related carbon-nitrogen hydrolase n=1 Tax=Carboxylicivirga sp. M1479 TaxID=2594476 RepID=UPI001178C0AC|nr:nitrilase-related carbon-nitrogen hydrolase [Carboxylicivirga sp. M1479]TRX70491.1 carbon-nitrogen hydrolase [Carboxylicivirga sp. M1479]
MRISLVQYAPKLNDPQANIDATSALIQSNNSDLYVLPELSNSGYNFNGFEEAYRASEELDNSNFIKALLALAKAKNTLIVSGFCERENRRLYNSSVLLGPNGIIGLYRKLHLFLNEKDIFTPGNKELPVFDTPWGKIGMLVCFDWMFPEAWRKLALQGAQLIAHPSNLVLPYCQSVVPSYALVNRCFIATANRIGTEDQLTFTGQSILANPNGEVLLRADTDKSQVLSTEIDLHLAKDKFITQKNDAFKDRRTDVYGNLDPK